jgi:hypothetical protein
MGGVMAKSRYKENLQVDWDALDGKKLTIQVSSGYIVGVESNGTPHVLMIGVQTRNSKPKGSAHGDAAVR